MRKRLKSVGILITLFFLAGFILLFVSLNITKTKKEVVKPPIKKVSLDHGVDITRPIIDISGWQLPADMDYDQLASQVNGVIVRVQHGISMKKPTMLLIKMGKIKPWPHT